MAKKITALKLQRRNRNRVNVYLDNEFAFGLSRIVAAWLRTGQELSDEKIAELQAKDGVEIALQRALNFLSYRARSEKEVRQNLTKHGHDESVIDEIIERLNKNGLIDDTGFAKMWVENRTEFRPRGSQVLRMELRQKGISDEIISSVLASMDETELAFRAAQKKARRYRELEYPDFRKKMTGFLARRGFHYGIIAEVLPKIWEELTSQNK